MATPAHGRLTPGGARLLRAARDYIVGHPGEFNWASWCGTRCCIAGHLYIAAGQRQGSYHSSYADRAAALLGFMSEVPCLELFYAGPADHDNVAAAVVRINDFLWVHGYPPNEVIVPGDTRTTEVPHAHA